MTTTEEQASGTVTLELVGMTCAACANRIERSLNKLDGVEAAVNFATDRAQVHFDPTLVSTDQLVGAVEKAGYEASVKRPTAEVAAGAVATAPPAAGACVSGSSARSCSARPSSRCR
jgi:Cu+-exporting ATPase